MDTLKQNQDSPAKIESRWRRRWLRYRPTINNLGSGLFYLLSDHWCGNESVPLQDRTLRFREHDGCDLVASFLNDSFEIGIGYPSQWQVILRRESIHKIIRWYLWNWAWGEWFGIRRWIWYKLLFWKLNRHRRALKPQHVGAGPEG